MFRRILTLAIVLGLMVSGSTSAWAAGATTETQTEHNVTDTFTDIVPCTGVSAVITTTGNEIMHYTIRPGGSLQLGADGEPTPDSYGFALTYTETGTFTAVGANGVTYSGHFTAWDGGSVNMSGVAVFTGTFTVVGTGSDGSRISSHMVWHFNYVPGHEPNVLMHSAGCDQSA